MCWRKWLVRGLVFAILGLLGSAGWVYQRWTSPAAVRQQVLANLTAHFPGACITLESAHLRLLGGIAFRELRMARRDDLDKGEFAYFPAGIIYHDKEQLLHGKLAVRKLELFRPRLRLSRDRDGKWNVAGLLGPVHPQEPVPTIVVQGATVLLEDHFTSGDIPPLEIKDVNLTVLNDPLSTVTFQATGTSELIGTVQIQGSWQRESDQAFFSVKAGSIAVGPRLLDRLAPYCPELAEQVGHLEGTAALQVDFSHGPGARPWAYDACLQLSGGNWSHPRVPFPLDHVQAKLHCTDGQLAVEKLTARTGPASLELSQVKVLGFSLNADVEGTLEVTHLQLSAKTFAHLPVALRKIQKEYSPAGPVSLKVHFARKSGQWSNHYIVEAEDVTASFWKFPYAIDHIQGTLEQEADPRQGVEVLKVDLVGYAGRQRVFIQGRIEGTGSEAGVDLRIWGNNLPLDAKIRRALLVPVYQKLARAFHPAGLANFTAFIRRRRGAKKFNNRYVIHFHDASIRYDVFPYPLEKVSGVLDIQPDHWEFSEFQGSHKGGEVQCRGRSFPSRGGNRLAIEIAGHNIALDDELAAALQPELKSGWKMFAPSGRMHFFAQVNCLPHHQPDVEVTLTAGAGCTIRPTFFPYVLGDMTGTVHYANRHIQVDKLTGRHGQAYLVVDKADVVLKQQGGVWAKLEFLRGQPLVPDNDFVNALPPFLHKVCKALRLRDPVGLTTQLIIETFAGEDRPPIVFWDGQLRLRNATLAAGVPLEHVSGTAGCRGLYSDQRLEGLIGNLLFDKAMIFKQPFRDIHSHMIVTREAPEVLQMPNLTAHLYGGNVGGDAWIEFGPTVNYDLNLTAAKIEVEGFGRHNLDSETRLSGFAGARIHLMGQGNDLKDLQGHGNLDITNGQLYNLPLLLDLLKVLGLRRPDGTAFEEAHADFSIRGPRIVISHVDLFGNSFSLRGQGEMNLDGTGIDLEFYAIWAKAIQMLPPIIKEIPPAISQNLLKIKMRGSIGNVQCTKEPVPVLVEPLRAFLERVSGKRATPTRGGTRPGN